MIKKFSLLVLFSMMSTNVWSLVDYSEGGGKTPSKQKVGPSSSSGFGSGGVSQSTWKEARPAVAPSSPTTSIFSLSGGYESLGINNNKAEGNIDIYSINGRIQTPVDIFVDAAYWNAYTRQRAFAANQKTQTGNPFFRLGLNWFKLGGVSDLSAVDFYVGTMLSGDKKSEFAASRSDQMAGVEMTKRFGVVAFGLNYEYRITGKPRTSEEMRLGNIQKIGAGLGMGITGDISFQTEWVTYRIRKGEGGENDFYLKDDLLFAYMSPKLILGLASFINFELGVKFRTKKLMVEDESSLLKARLMDLNGLYGNSFFSNLSFAL